MVLTVDMDIKISICLLSELLVTVSANNWFTGLIL